eukprot:2077900-Pleurochrysis_carterae.AAC.1
MVLCPKTVRRTSKDGLQPASASPGQVRARLHTVWRDPAHAPDEIALHACDAMAVAVMLTCYTAYAALSQRPVVQRWPAWPPVNADPRFRWVDGESSGPLGTHVDSFFEE